MKLKKPKFWDLKKPNLLSFFLLPLTIPILINNIVIRFANRVKDKRIKSICIGNIYIVGTGKTPLTIKLYEILKNLEYNICVGKKLYKSQKDEQKILGEKTRLITEETREKIIGKAIENKFELVIFDDGLQDKKIDYDLKFVCFDTQNWVGNGFLIPSGPLREKIDSLKKYDAVILKQIHKHKDEEEIINKIRKIDNKIKIFFSNYVPKNLKNFDLSKKYLIFSGIGNSNSFKEILIKYNFNVVDELIFPDHFHYNQKNLDTIIEKAKYYDAEIITTEKDFVKISKFNLSKIGFLELNLQIVDEADLITFIKSKIK